MTRSAIAFRTGKLQLEGIISLPEGTPGPYPAILVCHPHPKLGGNMENDVVAAICEAAAREGFASLRFNFRGVGGSEGSFGEGEREQQDVKAALGVLRAWPDVDRKRTVLAGYSFGAGVILEGLRHYKASRGLALVAPPISAVRTSRVRDDKRPKLFVVGDKDRLVESVALQGELDGVRQPVRFHEIQGADHGLSGFEEGVAAHVLAFARQALEIDGGT